jgi:hypothetical protein
MRPESRALSATSRPLRSPVAWISTGATGRTVSTEKRRHERPSPPPFKGDAGTASALSNVVSKSLGIPSQGVLCRRMRLTYVVKCDTPSSAPTTRRGPQTTANPTRWRRPRLRLDHPQRTKPHQGERRTLHGQPGKPTYHQTRIGGDDEQDAPTPQPGAASAEPARAGTSTTLAPPFTKP